MLQRRTLMGLGIAGLWLAGCATPAPGTDRPPIVFVHGNGDSAALWQTTLWRFESNGWPRERLHAIDMPYPLARDEDAKPQAGRSSTAEAMAFLKAEVDKVLATTGASRVVLISNSRGGYAVRNYIQNGGGDKTVSHAVLGGAPNHGVWSIKGFREGNEFAGTGPFLTALNAPKNAAGDEVTGPVRWLTIRSDHNDKYAQPDGLWIGAKGKPTGVSFAGPELRGATNVVIAGLDHRETSFSPAAFEAAWRFITGSAPATPQVIVAPTAVLNGKITGLGVDPLDARTGSFGNNLPVPGASMTIYAVDPATGERRGAPVHQKTVGADGQWGPFTADPGGRYEFVVAAPSYATAHIYRSPFPRGSDIVHFRAERIATADQGAKALLTFTRPRGYFDPPRDRMSLDGQTQLPGVPPGAGVSSSRLKLDNATARSVTAEFNGERIVGRVWPLEQQQVTLIELSQ
ncbi:MAG: twin-arginine translocation pathway signal [Ramlibacter sp.]|nr:twin-arginine translocation pathway signal [Ramlibacter sp.]